MYSAPQNAVFEATTILSTICAFAFGALALRDSRRDAPRARTAAQPLVRVLAALAQPLAQFVFVCLLLVVNQILCHAYILRAHHGTRAS